VTSVNIGIFSHSVDFLFLSPPTLFNNLTCAAIHHGASAEDCQIDDGAKVRSLLSRILTAIVSFFALYQLQLTRLRNDLFERLREQWHVDDEDYKDSIGQKNGLKANGDMGFSGSVSGPYTS
jgi:hypothetical protein